MPEEEPGNNRGTILDKLEASYSQAYSSWNQPVASVADNSVAHLNSDLVHSSNFVCVCEKSYLLIYAYCS